MALTISGTGNTAPGIGYAPILTSADYQYAYITGDSSYPAGGYTVSTNVIYTQLGFPSWKVFGVLPVYSGKGGWAIYWDQAFGTMRFFQIPSTTAVMTEASAGQNLSGVTVQVAVLGS